ncbi:hypothetical protein K437DRAFT_276990 [Tilletiaria anomala UBC 951]|uniref:Zn(2)-C6 fungal-type domain-containing protein n=1 Tax=Tilletiaria anomala (strain ATCC 24038 / CBS 436.72 / UBC 951) TaxID=1037660 RepID=A0A066V596_TILAU|nr:uncharacterized protein K437DRAFT_276990 [Tilletiaria anomala UBC 951]KDN35408.1 hypothetical protein K437DRAFT_276990 [Tilletiaria anomala UBC 951]
MSRQHHHHHHPYHPDGRFDSPGSMPQQLQLQAQQQNDSAFAGATSRMHNPYINSSSSSNNNNNNSSSSSSSVPSPGIEDLATAATMVMANGQPRYNPSSSILMPSPPAAYGHAGDANSVADSPSTNVLMVGGDTDKSSPAGSTFKTAAAAGGANTPSVGKGTRIGKACLPCSSKKRRCDGNRPQCSVCTVLNLPCTYSASTIKRGPPKGFRSGPKESAKVKLLRTLETTLRDLIGKLGADEAAEEVRKLGAEKGIDLSLPQLDGGATAVPSYSELPASGAVAAVVAEGDSAETRRPAKRGRFDAESSASRRREHDEQSSAQGLLSLSNLARTQSPASRSSATWDAERDGERERDGDGAGNGNGDGDEDGDDFLGVNERGDLMHRGSSSGIQLLHQRRGLHHHAHHAYHPPHHTSPLAGREDASSRLNLSPHSSSSVSPSSGGGVGGLQVHQHQHHQHLHYPQQHQHQHHAMQLDHVIGTDERGRSHSRQGTSRSTPGATSGPGGGKDCVDARSASASVSAPAHPHPHAQAHVHYDSAPPDEHAPTASSSAAAAANAVHQRRQQRSRSRDSSRVRHAALAYGPLRDTPGAPVPLPLPLPHQHAHAHGHGRGYGHAPASPRLGPGGHVQPRGAGGGTGAGDGERGRSGFRGHGAGAVAVSWAARSLSRGSASRSRSPVRGRSMKRRDGQVGSGAGGEAHPNAKAHGAGYDRGEAECHGRHDERAASSPFSATTGPATTREADTDAKEHGNQGRSHRAGVEANGDASASETHSETRAEQEYAMEDGDADFIEAPIDFVNPDNDPVVDREECGRLFEYYWKEFHPFWPVLFKPAIRDIPTEEVADRVDSVLLFSIYAVASCIVPPERTKSDGSQQEQENRGQIFYERAERYLYAGRLRPDVPTIQSLFLLSLYAHGKGELSQAWVYSNLASTMAFDLGLHRWPVHRYDLLYDENERETRIRLIWQCYILDKILSAEMGRPVTIRSSDLDAPFLSENLEDGDEKIELFVGGAPSSSSASGEESKGGGEARMMNIAPCINWSIKLFIILEKILSEFHSFRRKAALRKQGNILDSVAAVDAELAEWHAALPSYMRTAPLLDRLRQTKASESVSLPVFLALELWYHTSILLLHRNFIPQDEGAALSEVLRNESHRKCTAAANAICDVLETTSQYVRIDRLSTDLSYCFFTAAVMFVFNACLPDATIAADAKRRFMLCRESLRKLSETWPAASAHKQLLDGFSMVGEGVLTEDSTVLDLMAPSSASNGTGAGANTDAPPGSPLRRSRASSNATTSWEVSNARSAPAPQQKTGRTGVATRTAQGQGQGLVPDETPPSFPQNLSVAASTARERRQSAGQQDRAEAWIPQQREQMLQLYANSGSGGQRPNASAHSYAPGLFDLEQVFYNEWKPGTSMLQPPQQQQPHPPTIQQPHQQQAQQMQSMQPRINGADGLVLLANASGPMVQIPGQQMSPGAFPGSNLPAFPPTVMHSEAPAMSPAAVAGMQQIQAYRQQLQNSQQGMQPQAQTQGLMQASQQFLQVPGMPPLGLAIPGLSQQPSNLAGMSPFSFNIGGDPQGNGFLDLMAMLELPPAFAQ